MTQDKNDAVSIVRRAAAAVLILPPQDAAVSILHGSQLEWYPVAIIDRHGRRANRIAGIARHIPAEKDETD